jgi:hypothetical protein
MSTRHLHAFPTWALLLVALLVAMFPTEQPPHQEPDYTAQGHAIVQAEIARLSAGRPCVQTVQRKATDPFPRTALVSQTTGALVATSVEPMPWADAWNAALAGRVTIRCVIA